MNTSLGWGNFRNTSIVRNLNYGTSAPMQHNGQPRVAGHSDKRVNRPGGFASEYAVNKQSMGPTKLGLNVPLSK
jgi:hypothetical protein